MHLASLSYSGSKQVENGILICQKLVRKAKWSCKLSEVTVFLLCILAVLPSISGVTAETTTTETTAATATTTNTTAAATTTTATATAANTAYSATVVGTKTTSAAGKVSSVFVRCDINIEILMTGLHLLLIVVVGSSC